MKKKIFIVLLVLTLVSVVALGAIACTGTGNTTKPNTPGNGGGGSSSNKIINPLPDMEDVGASEGNWKVSEVTYDTSKKSEWVTKLEDKQVDNLGDWMDGEEEVLLRWVRAISKSYISFGPKAIGKDQDEARWQDNRGYFGERGNWITDGSANTVERLFLYSKPEDVITRLAKAHISEEITEGIVNYITRDDAERVTGLKDGYNLEKGVGSAIEDYKELDELEEIYENWSDYTKGKDNFADYPDKEHGGFANKDDVYDVMSLKERKIYAEVFDIFEDQYAQFARTAIALCSYSIQLIEVDMIGAYEFHLGGSMNSDNKIVDYMRDEVYDYETLSYLLSFREYVKLTANYEPQLTANAMGNAMSLYGYHYQYKYRDYQTFDDTKKVKYNGKEMTEYEHFLKLSHCNDNDYYFNTEKEALDYRNYDRRQYEKSYRYTYACYQKYYIKQLNFQALQEKYDREIYVGGHSDIYKDGIGMWDKKAKSTETYTAEMETALETGFEATLKISDVNYEYTGVDQYVLAYNAASKAWNSLDENAQNSPKNLIYKVRLEIEQLKSQDYTLNHKTISTVDLTNALKYQIKSYSADSIRGIQGNKKDDVIYYKDIERFFAVTGMTEEDMSKITTDDYIKTAYEGLAEDGGRNIAKYANLTSNYSMGNVNEQMTAADKAKWNDDNQGLGVKGNIKTTLQTDFDTYARTHDDVDKYFEDTLIKKKWSCGAQLDDEKCPDNKLANGDFGGHIGSCEKVYDTDWALSRLLDNHEVVLRYMYGQIEVTFYKIKDNDFKASDKFFDAGKANNKDTNKEAMLGGWYKITQYDKSGTTNVMSNEAIGTAVRDGYSEDDEIQVIYPWMDGSSLKWKNKPSYKGIAGFDDKGELGIKITKSTIECTYTFVGWYVDEAYNYPVLLDEEIDYDIRLYPCYQITFNN